MDKKRKQTAWHKKKGKIVSAKYAKERPSGDTLTNSQKAQSSSSSRAKRFITHLKKQIKKSLKD